MTAPAAPAGGPGDRTRFVGLAFDRLDLAATLAWIEAALAQDRFAYVVTPNSDHVVRYAREQAQDELLRDAYRGADLVVCDSRILARLSRLSGERLPIAPGSDLTRDLLARGGPWRHLAVIGGDEALHRRLEALYPAYRWSFLTPPFGLRRSPERRAEIQRFVEEAAADIVLFAVGAPQSELCCLEIRRAGRARGVALCIGASLEFVTGVKRRAPRWMQLAGIEWLHRLASEPQRLWRRYLLDSPRVFAIWWRGGR